MNVEMTFALIVDQMREINVPAGVKRFIVLVQAVCQTRTSVKKMAAKRNTATSVKATSCVTHFVQNAHSKGRNSLDEPCESFGGHEFVLPTVSKTTEYVPSLLDVSYTYVN